MRASLPKRKPTPQVCQRRNADTEYRLSLFEQEIAREVLNSHVTGYSTTTHDVIHDLIP
jgi:hypothetical protein